MTDSNSTIEPPCPKPGAAVSHSDAEALCRPEQRPALLAAAIVASAMGFIDSTIVSIALPAMRETLDASLRQGLWFHSGYLLTLSALILTGGAMADRFGLARVFAVGIGLFLLASLACAVATGPEALIAARAVQGLGAAVMIPGSLALIARAYPDDIRGRAIGLWAAASAVTTTMGPVLAGLALSFGGAEMWRWLFAMNLPLGALALWLLWRGVQRDAAKPGTPVDWLGALLATVSLLVLSWGLTVTDAAGGPAPDLRWIGAGLVGMVVFVAVQGWVRAPMMPLTLFANRVFSAANAMSFLIYIALSTMLFFMPMVFITGWGISEIDAAAIYAPMGVFLALLSARAGRMADRFGPAPLLCIGAGLVALGYGAMGWLAPGQAFWSQMLPAMCLVGIGMGLVVAPLSTAVMGAAPQSMSGTASGINNALSRLAGLVSVAAFGGLAATVYAASGGTASFGLPSNAAGHGAATTAAFQALAYAAAGLSAIGAGLAPLTRAPRG